jgi:hypothetical protein
MEEDYQGLKTDQFVPQTENKTEGTTLKKTV